MGDQGTEQYELGWIIARFSAFGQSQSRCRRLILWKNCRRTMWCLGEASDFTCSIGRKEKGESFDDDYGTYSSKGIPSIQWMQMIELPCLVTPVDELVRILSDWKIKWCNILNYFTMARKVLEDNSVETWWRSARCRDLDRSAITKKGDGREAARAKAP